MGWRIHPPLPLPICAEHEDRVFSGIATSYIQIEGLLMISLLPVTCSVPFPVCNFFSYLFAIRTSHCSTS